MIGGGDMRCASSVATGRCEEIEIARLVCFWMMVSRATQPCIPLEKRARDKCHQMPQSMLAERRLPQVVVAQGSSTV